MSKPLPEIALTADEVEQTSKRIEGQGIKQVDFLGSIIGLETERIKRHAVAVHLADGTHLPVLHPLDVLESRLKNIAALPSKRDTQGIAQANLAIDITRAYLEQLGRERQRRAKVKKKRVGGPATVSGRWELLAGLQQRNGGWGKILGDEARMGIQERATGIS